MQAVILAAGRGTRMKELTESTPKALLEIGGKTILEREFDILPEEVDEVIIIVGYLGGLVQKKFGGEYEKKKILYVEQEKLDGTAGALWRAKDILKDRFLVLMADDLYSKKDAEHCIAKENWTMLVQETSRMNQGGRVITDEEGKIADIEEGDHRGRPGLISTNMFCIDMRIFQHPLVPKSIGSEEFGLPQTVLAASKASGTPFEIVKATFWFQITKSEDLQKAQEMLENT